MSKTCEEVFGMSAEKVASLIVQLYGKKIVLEVIGRIADEIGYNKLARLAGITAGAISNALRRNSMREDTMQKILYAVAKEKPHILKYHLERVIREYGEQYRSIMEELVKIIEESS